MQKSMHRRLMAGMVVFGVLSLSVAAAALFRSQPYVV